MEFQPLFFLGVAVCQIISCLHLSRKMPTKTGALNAKPVRLTSNVLVSNANAESNAAVATTPVEIARAVLYNASMALVILRRYNKIPARII